MEVAGANRRWRLQFRCRGSRRESAVAQLFSLGVITLLMKFISKTRELLTDRAAELTIATIVGLTGTVATWIGAAALPAISQHLPMRELLMLLALSTLANAISVIAIWRLRKPEKMDRRFGILWDRDLQPHCPNCSSLLHSLGDYKLASGFDGYGMLCSKCNISVGLSDDDGNSKTLDELRKLVRKKTRLQQP